MKQTILMLCLCGGLMVVGCDSNKRSSKAFGKKNSSAAAKPANSSNTQTTVNTSSNNTANTTVVSGSVSAKNKLDSLLMQDERSSNSRPGTYFQASGVGSGGSYASSAYRHDEMNKQKYEKKALARQERNLMIQKLQAELDSINNQNNLQVEVDSVDAPLDSMQFSKK